MPVQHDVIPANKRHPIIAHPDSPFTDAAARTAHNIQAADIDKPAIQSSDNTRWLPIATGTGADKWVQIGGTSSGGAGVLNVVPVSGTFSIVEGTHLGATLLIDNSSAVVINMPAAPANGFYVDFKCTGTGQVTWARAASEQLEGAAANLIMIMAGGSQNFPAKNSGRWFWRSSNAHLMPSLDGVAVNA